MSQMIIVEGIIGVGKSTFTEAVGKKVNYKIMREPVYNNPYLSRFYEDPKRYALEMQFYLMSTRYKMHQQAIESIWKTGQGALFDRSIWGDTVFCEKNYLDGNIGKLGYQNYLKMRDVMLKHLMVPQVTIYLDAEPEVCLERIKERSRDCEQSIPVAYLKGLAELYDKLLRDLEARGSIIIKLNWNEFVDYETVIDDLRDRKLLIGNFKEYPEMY